MFQKGEVVAYSAKFLQSICDYSKRSADKRFTVSRVETFSDGFTLVHFETNSNQTTSSANIKNLKPVRKGIVIE